MSAPVGLKPFNIVVRGSVEKEFKSAAKEAFPKETFAYLLGHSFADRGIIEDLYFPQDVGQFCTTDTVYVQPRWLREAKQYARSIELAVIGEIHSHPYTYFSGAESIIRAGRILSESDFDRKPFGINGLCVVVERKSGQLVSSCRYYPPIRPVKLKLEKD